MIINSNEIKESRNTNNIEITGNNIYTVKKVDGEYYVFKVIERFDNMEDALNLSLELGSNPNLEEECLESVCKKIYGNNSNNL